MDSFIWCSCLSRRIKRVKYLIARRKKNFQHHLLVRFHMEADLSSIQELKTPDPDPDPAKMPSARRMILGHVMSGLCSKMNRTKQLPADLMETPLNRCLNTFDITLLGTYRATYAVHIYDCGGWVVRSTWANYG